MSEQNDNESGPGIDCPDCEGWKNKWECAVEMAARATAERDEARRMWSMHQDKGAELHIRVVDLQSRVDEAVSALQHHHRSRRGIDAIIAVLSNDRRDAASQTKNENE